MLILWVSLHVVFLYKSFEYSAESVENIGSNYFDKAPSFHEKLRLKHLEHLDNVKKFNTVSWLALNYQGHQSSEIAPNSSAITPCSNKGGSIRQSRNLLDELIIEKSFSFAQETPTISDHQN